MSKGDKRAREIVLPVAEHIADTLRPFCDRLEIAGSLRRGRPAVSDIEIVAIPKRPVDLFGNELPKAPTPLDNFLKAHMVEMVKNGARYKQFRYGRFTVDLFLPTPETWGAIYTIRTGSHEFNMWLMNTLCPARGVRFHEGRLYAGDGRLLDTPEEAAVFTALDLPYIPPECRDDSKWMEYYNGAWQGEKMENERELPVKESLVQEIIGVIYARHEIEHRNCDYEVCNDPICAAGQKLETDTGVYEEWSQEEIDEAKETAGRWKELFETPDFANQVYEARIDTGIRKP